MGGGAKFPTEPFRNPPWVKPSKLPARGEKCLGWSVKNNISVKSLLVGREKCLGWSIKNNIWVKSFNKQIGMQHL